MSVAIPDVTFVIPNYNGADLLPACLQAINAAIACYRGTCEIIVVDDGSQDGSQALIAADFNEVRLIQHAVNRGFAEAVTTGIRAATTDIVILLNTDVRPDRFFISPLVRWFVLNDVFSVSPLIYDEQGQLTRFSLNRRHWRYGDLRDCAWTLAEIETAVATGTAVNSLYASGGSLALRKAMFLQLGGFWDLFKPFYVEDQDLGTRAWRCGWRTVVEPHSWVIHCHRGTIRRLFDQRYVKRIQQRNRLFFLWLHAAPWRLGLSLIPKMLLRLPIRLLKFDSIYLSGLLLAIARLPEVVRERRRFKYLRSFQWVLDESCRMQPVTGLPSPAWAVKKARSE